MALNSNQIKSLLENFDNRWVEPKKVEPPKAMDPQIFAGPDGHIPPSALAKKPQYTRPMAEEGEQSGRLPPVEDVPVDALLALLDAIAHFDPIVIQNSETGCADLSSLSPEQRQAIRSVEIREEFQKGVKVGEVVKILFWDKMAAIEMLAKYKKMFQEEKVSTNFVIITDKLKRGAERIKTIKGRTVEVLDKGVDSGEG